MGTVVVTEFVTLDGVMEDPGGAESFEHGGWAFKFKRGADGDKFKLDEVKAAEAMLLGRVTYEGFAAAWPGRSDDVGFADKMNAIPKFVVSTTLDNATWNNSTILDGDLEDEVRSLKQRIDGDILVAGSCRLVHSLLALDLVDEFRLMVFPIVLGSGRRLFGEGVTSKSLQLVDNQPAAECVILTYRQRRDAGAG